MKPRRTWESLLQPQPYQSTIIKAFAALLVVVAGLAITALAVGAGLGAVAVAFVNLTH